MVRLAIVDGLTYTDMGQVRGRWLIPTYADNFRWTGNRADAEDLAAWIFHKIGGELRGAKPVRVVDERVAELTSEAIARHWSERYGVVNINRISSRRSDSQPALESLLSDLTAEMHLTLILRFVRRRSIAAIASQLRVSTQQADRRVFVALTQVAERIGLSAPPEIPLDLVSVSDFVSDLVARRRPVRFEARSDTWAALIAACHIQAAIAGNALPIQRFVRSFESPTRRLVTELRIWSA